ncbi:alkaline phosphatase, tissue-nonspecific isozyme-like [Uranotaenia lowii]|uniref:alkaline phosphatase, tissue-nonspecific isozyme-like n=1 Tax=Uranotaenia lowii TaxID=190385 RepID=UPI0024797187|nr:alkaline phosphatase, tissue-nonspecific isozyme-like [Uranotaenia lowii]
MPPNADKIGKMHPLAVFGLILLLRCSFIDAAPRIVESGPRVDPPLTPAPTPYPTHPMDDPEWIPPMGPVEELDQQFWIDSGQRLLGDQISGKNHLNLNVAKNVIIFIGDGMSITTQSATRVYMGGEAMELSFEKFPYTGLAKTYCINYQVSDSGCTAAAILTGVKNNYGTIAVSGQVPLMNCQRSLEPENRLTSILKYAQQDGRSTGIVTNTRITHATPAVAYAVSGARYWEDDEETPSGCVDIAAQLIHGEIGRNLTVALGGGSRHFYPTGVQTMDGGFGRRRDNRFLVNEWLAMGNLREENRSFVHNRQTLDQVDESQVDRLFGLFSANHMSYRMDNSVEEPTLEEMTSKALKMVSKNVRGYVLIIEGGRIDHAHHDNLARLALDETVELHRAVQYVARQTNDRDTLILVTADHSHTMTMGGYPVRGNNILATGDFSRLDRMPFFTLSYANGMSYFDHYPPTGGRNNPFLMDSQRADFRFPGAVPYEDETHGGDDVAVFARGPHAHLFSGLYEQHLIGHLLWYASCLGPDGLRRSEACLDRLTDSGGLMLQTPPGWIVLPLVLVVAQAKVFL